MSDFESLLNAIPKDPNVAFILADYLEERGDPRCELLRLSYSLRDTIKNTPNRWAMEERLRELILIERIEPVAPTISNKSAMDFVWIPPGTFWMGSPEGEELEREDNETQHQVTLTKGFWMSRTPVTQRQWADVMGRNPSHFQGEDRPVEMISWEDSQEFCKAVSEVTGWKTHLPTEAQWEYACRAGTTTPFWFGGLISAELLNCDGTNPRSKTYAADNPQKSLGETVPVKQYPPNPWGLYQVHGNVWEWCQDYIETYTTQARVDPVYAPEDMEFRALRGGGFVGYALGARSAARDYESIDHADNCIGFRCLVIPQLD